MSFTFRLFSIVNSSYETRLKFADSLKSDVLHQSVCVHAKAEIRRFDQTLWTLRDCWGLPDFTRKMYYDYATRRKTDTMTFFTIYVLLFVYAHIYLCHTITRALCSERILLYYRSRTCAPAWHSGASAIV